MPGLTWGPSGGARVPSPLPFLSHPWCQAGKSEPLGHLAGQMGSQQLPLHSGLPGD